MKINGLDPRQVAGLYDRLKAQQKPAAGKTADVPSGDRAEISAAGRELQIYRARLREMSGVRTELVARLQKQVADGTYRPDAYQTAAGIIAERRLDGRV
ncbi:flagellar biosynthesis anti-sigma factor FlgM [Desulfotomaculum copahuensis]|uniref:Negative regulator of flagellin synthesis n=1 Tax=Desulfotomaculum copahuensis TaxID=1838280 RepID=A0A1B7LCI2_9FIRM|nr:flagellar biosynthesis anti-sigma factor FlgM [Desulfotomaculum copahuensis]OAT80370.1 flagellar biosynthesis anti-sigma factor FlgM [Desulfotomaculum copahuensis]